MSLGIFNIAHLKPLDGLALFSSLFWFSCCCVVRFAAILSSLPLASPN